MNKLPCIKCGTAFDDVNGLVHHLNSYPSSEKDRFKCIFHNCFILFSDKNTLKKHLDRHVGKGIKYVLC